MQVELAFTSGDDTFEIHTTFINFSLANTGQIRYLTGRLRDSPTNTS